MKKYRLKRYPHLYSYRRQGKRLYGFRITKTVHGVRHDFRGRDFSTAAQALAGLHADLSHPVQKSVLRPKHLTLGKWALKLEKARRMQWKPSTRINFVRICRNDLLPHLGNVPLTKITPLLYQSRVVNPLTKRGFRKSSLSTVQSVMSELLNAASAEGLLPSNPLRGFRLQQGRPRRQKRLMTRQQFQDFLKSLRREPWASRFLFTLLGLTGLRMGEALGLQWGDLTDHLSVLHVRSTRDSNGRRKPKTPRSRRKFRLPKALSQLAVQYHAVQAAKLPSDANPDHYVVVDRHGTPLTSGDVSRRLKQCLTDAGLSSLQGHFTAHTFRHQFASYLIAAGVPIADVSKTLGHANPAITLRVYTQAVPKRTASNLSEQMLKLTKGDTHHA